jgi:hypothetical protein
VITLKSDKAFEEFTQALMAFISNAQMVDPKFVINPLNPSSKKKSISSKAEVSPNMTKLGIHIKMGDLPQNNHFITLQIDGQSPNLFYSNYITETEKRCCIQ